MKKLLHHGSRTIIQKPIYGQGKPYNDYGLGFYCTDSLEMAKEWAADATADGYANCYQLDLEGLRILNLNDYSMLHWLSMLLRHREFETSLPLAREAKGYLLNTFSIEGGDYDIILGYRADDSYFSFAQDFIGGTISYRQLCNAMHLGKLGQQLVLKSPSAFARLEFLRYEVASSQEWYSKKMARDLSARSEYFDLERNSYQRDDIYIPQIINEEMTADDPRLR